MPSFTRTFHGKPYAAICPSRPELSASGKTVLITGAGSGIGAATAVAFAQAGAKKLILCGRRLEALEKTKAEIDGRVEVVVKPMDVTSEEQVQKVFGEVGPVDILINGAGHLADPGSIASTELENFWTSFEVNVKGTFLVLQSWLRNLGESDPTFISLNSLVSHLPAEQAAHCPASYAASKIATGKLMEFVAKEEKGVRGYSLHPGVIKTEMSLRSCQGAEDPEAFERALPWDDIDLPAHFCVWLASPEGREIPSGKFLWANWDVEELTDARMGVRRYMEEYPMALTLTLSEWPFAEPEVVDANQPQNAGFWTQ